MGKWEMVRLGDVFKIASGGTPAKNRLDYYNKGTIPWVKTGDLKEKYINSEYVERITDLGLANSSAKLFPSDTVLIAMYGATIGATSILNFEACTNQACAAFLPSQSIQSEFLYYFLLSQKANFIKLGVGGAQPNISATILKEVKMPLPPLDEQKRIAKNLDLASEIVKGYKEQITELDKLVQSVFYEMFDDPVTNEKGWEIKPLKSIALGKLSYGSGASAIPFDGTIRYLRITDINENGRLNNDVVSPNQYDSKYVLHDGDILFARSGATVGKAFRYSDIYGKCLYAGYLIRLIPDKTLILPDYVFSFTKSQYYRRFIEKNMKVVAQPNINAQQYGNLDICVPPLPLQTRFASIVTEIETQKAQIQEALTEAENLFNSLMQEYFE